MSNGKAPGADFGNFKQRDSTSMSQVERLRNDQDVSRSEKRYNSTVP